MEYLLHPKGKLAFHKSGNGPSTFLIFHGFGQSHEDMLPFEEIRKPDQRFYYIDMFYHGRSQWFDSGAKLDRSTWKELIKTFQKQENFSDFHLIGYSMGGKFSLLTYELFAKKILSMTLIAPDGIKTGLWYSMSNYPKFIHPLFKGVVFKPNRFFGIIDRLNSSGLVEKSLVKFVKNQLETRSMRAQAYFVWKVLGGLQLPLGKIIQLTRNHLTPITLVIGEFDRMVTHDNLRRFSDKIPNLNQIILPVGHGKLIKAYVEHQLFR